MDLIWDTGDLRTDRIQLYNLPLRIGSHFDIWEKIMKEVKLGRYAGPFPNIPYENYIQSPIGLVPKDNGTKTRLIFHLSYNFKRDKLPNKSEQKNNSINHHTPDELCSVKYKDIDHAVKVCLQIIKQAKELGEFNSNS